MHYLAIDELGIVFSYLEPVENIPSLNLVCRTWYEASSTVHGLHCGVNTGLWRQWYYNAIDYYAVRMQTRYKRKCILKKKTKVDHRDYRVLLRGIITGSHRILNAKVGDKINRIFCATYTTVNYCTVDEYLDNLFLLFRSKKNQVAKLVQTNGQKLFNRLIGIICRCPNASKLFTKVCELVAEFHLPTNETKFMIENWRTLLGDVYQNSWSIFLPTQELIFYGHFNEAKILHEQYGCALSLQVNDNLTITSTNMLLYHDILRQTSGTNRTKFFCTLTTTPKVHAEMLTWLIEKEGMQSVVYDLKQTLYVITTQYPQTMPLFCLVKQFYCNTSIPLIKVLIEYGEDMNRKFNGQTAAEVFCDFCERNVRKMSPWVYIRIPGDLCISSEIVNLKLAEMLELFREYSGEDCVLLEERFSKITDSLR